MINWEAEFEVLRAKFQPLEEELEEARELLAEAQALRQQITALREALFAIRDHKPDVVEDKIDHDVENCPDCKRMKGHPISHGLCNEWYHQHYRIENKRKDAEHREQYQMRSLARQALAATEPKARCSCVSRSASILNPNSDCPIHATKGRADDN